MSLCRSLAIASVVMMLTGCSSVDDSKWLKDRKPVYQVNGKVTHKGTPLSGAAVAFRSGDAANAIGAAGLTDAEGKFTLTTYETGDGAVEGRHVVTVAKSVVEGEDPSYFDEKSPNYGKTPPPTKVKSLIPTKYARPESSGLSAEVKKDGPNDITIELKD
ncbi:hypothetical protein Pan44_22610 [Caulifigura coniformis]|uniref:Nickel uptake substrate-specific transmembrane region n=1 Tax=Caulifigura coniformis TaxID=2527983 RepID=A0A517SDN3_9PLAN|nr:hypothetical protein [Caulifigura coniformis]QDT54233.1 hypothetical protein Pan44_22610 [Caulifigura coniformis]